MRKLWLTTAVLLGLSAFGANVVRAATFSFEGTIDSIDQDIPPDFAAVRLGMPVTLDLQLADDSLGLMQASITSLEARIGDVKYNTQQGRIDIVNDNADIIDVFSGGGFFDGYNISFVFVDQMQSALSATDTFETADYSQFTEGEFFVYSHQVRAPVIWATGLQIISVPEPSCGTWLLLMLTSMARLQNKKPSTRR